MKRNYVIDDFWWRAQERARARVFHYDSRIVATCPFVTTVASSPSLMHPRLRAASASTQRLLCRNFGVATPLTGGVSLGAQSNSSRVLRFAVGLD